MEKIYRVKLNSKGMPNFSTAVEIDTDISEYSDKLWRNAYERGKADRPQGEWIEQEDCWQCSECGDEYVLEVGVKPIDARMHFCPNCGARMLAKDTNVPNKKGAGDETNNNKFE